MGVTIDLSLLDDEPTTFGCDLAVPADRVDSDQVTAPLEVRLDGEVRPVGGEFVVRGRYAAVAPVTCSRCLAPVDWTDAGEFDLRYRIGSPPGGEEEVELGNDDLDVAWLPDGVLDLEQLAAEQAMLALPMRTVCDPECAGLCPRCGADRNRAGDCRCEPDTDPRWAALADVRVRES